MSVISFNQLYWLDYSQISGVSRDDRLRIYHEGHYLAVGSEHREPWDITLPIEWGSNPFRDSDWRYQLNGWRLIEPALQEYEVTRDPSLIRSVMPYIRDWKRFNIDEKGVNRYKWYDACVALRALKLAYLILVSDRDRVLNPEERSFIIDIAGLHTKKLTDSKNIVPNNHAFFQLHGAMALCRIHPSLDGCDGGVQKVKQLFAHAIVQQFGKEGMHKEHSPAYHFFVYQKIRKFLDTGWYEGIDVLDEIEQKVLANAAWLIDQNGSVIEVGDSSPRLRDIGHIQLESGAEDCVTIEAYTPACFGSRLFREAGFAIARSLPPIPARNASLLFMSGAYHSKTHRHADDLAFVWMEGGQWILSDTGRYTYGDGERRAYTRSTQAHNTVDVDGKSASIDPKYAYGSAIDDLTQTEWGFDFVGKVWHKDNNFFHHRRILYRPGDWVIVIDRLKNRCDNESEFTSWFHFAEGSKARIEHEKVVVTLANGLDIHLLQYGDFGNCARNVAVGETEPLQGWRAKNFHHLVPRPALSFSGRGQNGLMVHLFTVGPRQAEIKSDNTVIRASIDGWSFAIRSVTSVSMT